MVFVYLAIIVIILIVAGINVRKTNKEEAKFLDSTEFPEIIDDVPHPKVEPTSSFHPPVIEDEVETNSSLDTIDFKELVKPKAKKTPKMDSKPSTKKPNKKKPTNKKKV
jgi:hypothetical protein